MFKKGDRVMRVQARPGFDTGIVQYEEDGMYYVRQNIGDWARANFPWTVEETLPFDEDLYHKYYYKRVPSRVVAQLGGMKESYDTSDLDRLDATLQDEQTSFNKKLSDIWLPFFRTVVHAISLSKTIKYDAPVPKAIKSLSDDPQYAFRYGGGGAGSDAHPKAVLYWIRIYYRKKEIAKITAYAPEGYLTKVTHIAPRYTEIDMSYKEAYQRIFIAAKQMILDEKEQELRKVDTSRAMLDMSFEESVKALIREGYADDEIVQYFLENG